MSRPFLDSGTPQPSVHRTTPTPAMPARDPYQEWQDRLMEEDYPVPDPERHWPVNWWMEAA